MAVAVMAEKIRLDKYLVEMGKGSRTQVKEAARKGRILVNGVPEKKTDRKIDPQCDEVTLDGERVGYRALEYFMLNKPQGVVSATEDRLHRTVIDLLCTEKRTDLFPVGRLDIDTEGLLILTNDGALAHRLLAPRRHVDKEYYAEVAGALPPDAAAQMAAGMTLGDGTQLQAASLVVLEADGEQAKTRLTIREGKFHQVKRMFEALGCRVTYLKRLSMGALALDEGLMPGQFRRLTEEELALLQQSGAQSRAETDPAAVRACLDRKSAVIFDLDGTLVDSMWMWKAIDIEYLGRYGYECPPLLQKEIEGMSFSETADYFKRTFRLPDTIDEIKQAWVEMSIEKYRSEVPLKKGALRFLQYLKASGIRAGIATSNGREMVDVVLESLGITPYFQDITTACEVAAGKPAPDIYLKVAASLGVSPQQCMVFEDVPAGILAGKAAGMAVCAVEDVFSAPVREEKMQLADYYIEDYDALLDGGQ